MLKPWFDSAPVSKALIALLSVFFVLSGYLSSSKDAFDLNLYPAIATNGQWYRVVTSQLFFTSTTEVLLGCLSFYIFRIVERLYGSRKFLAAVVFSLLFGCALQLVCLVLFRPALVTFASGPYAILFGLYAIYASDVPRMSKFKVVGVTFSDKSFSYVLGVQLMWSQYWLSVYPSLVGLLVGIVWKVTSFRNLRLPMFITQCCVRSGSRRGEHIPVATRTPPSSNPSGRSSSNNSVSAPSVENDLAVSTLLSLGFDMQQARTALSMTGGNVDLAAAMLLQND